MNSRHLPKITGSSLAALATAATVAQSPAALAQTSTVPPAPQVEAGAAAAPNPGQTAAQSYVDQYANWAAQNCVDQRTGNTAAGAIVGGALGAIAGAALTGGHSSGALAGGAVGAVTGAALSASAPCPPGYAVRTGAPAFVYAGPVFEPGLSPPLSRPWVWVGGRWVYYPYRYAYWAGPRGRWAPRPWAVHHRL